MEKGCSILVTGGAGYLGSVMVPALLAAGHEVTVLDNFMYRRNSLAAVCGNARFEVVNGDARSEEALRPLVKHADIVIPLAALVGAPACDRDPTAATSTILDAVTTLIGLMSKQQQLMVATTNSGYGIGEADSFCTEETPLRPISLYGRLKVAAEAAALDRGNAISFRLATAFGASPRMRTDLLVNGFVQHAVCDGFVTLFEGHFKRNYIHVRDVARVFLHGIENFEAMNGGPYNVGLSDANLSKIELCERIKAQLPGFAFDESAEGKDPDKRDYIVSNEKIEATGFLPCHSLDDGIRELIKVCTMIRDAQYTNL